MKLAISVIACLVFASLAGAQTVTLRIRVVDAGGGQPLAAARILDGRDSVLASTGRDGAAVVRLRAARGATFLVSHAAFEDTVLAVPRRSASLAVALRRRETLVTEVTIEAYRPLVDKNVTSCRTVMSAEDIGNLPVRGIGWDENTEEYASLRESGFRNPERWPLSTFAIDVDVASYGNARRFLEGGSLPPADAVRVEEMVNYFSYAYPQPIDGRPFAVSMDMHDCPWNARALLLRVGLQARRVAADSLPPGNLVFLLDASGSMSADNKLPLVQKAFRLLAAQLRETDRVAVVAYRDSAWVVLPSTPGGDRSAIVRAVESLHADGCTAGAAGLQLAYRIAAEHAGPGVNSRVIIATDGDFNVGISATADLEHFIEQRRREGVYLSVLGFGMGNYKDAKLETLADKGNGNYAYVDDLREARRVFVSELGGTLLAVARDVKLQVEFNPRAVRSYRLIGYENRAMADEDFRNDSADAGELGAGQSVTALYEIIPASGTRSPDAYELRYQRLVAVDTGMARDEALMLSVRYTDTADSGARELRIPFRVPAREGAATGDFQFASAVAEFALLLRDSPYRGDASFGSVLDRARRGRGDDASGDRAEFIRLVELAQAIAEARKL